MYCLTGRPRSGMTFLSQHISSLLLIQSLSTWALVGVIHVVHWVHYPLFARVGQLTYRDYQAQHMTRITPVVAPLMVMELVSATLWTAASWTISTGLAQKIELGIAWFALIAIWLVTGLWSVRAHRDLLPGFSFPSWKSLMASNAVRTGLWSLRALWLAHLLYERLKPNPF